MPTQARKAQITPRKLPRQQRAKATIDRVFAATRQLLAEQGPSSISTGRIAAAAGVNVASIYQYFPNKQAILCAIYQERLDEVIAVFNRHEEQGHLEIPADDYFNRLFDDMDALQWGSKSDAALLVAMHNYEGLTEIVDAHRDNVVQRLAQLFRHFGSSWPEQRLVDYAEYIYSLDAAAADLMTGKSDKERRQLHAWSRQTLMPLVRDCLE